VQKDHLFLGAISANQAEKSEIMLRLGADLMVRRFEAFEIAAR